MSSKSPSFLSKFRKHKSPPASTDNPGSSIDSSTNVDNYVESAYIEGQRTAEHEFGKKVKHYGFGFSQTPKSPQIATDTRGGSSVESTPTKPTKVIAASSVGKVITTPPKVNYRPVDRDRAGDFSNDKKPIDETVVDSGAVYVHHAPQYADDASRRQGTGYFFDPSDTQGGYYRQRSTSDKEAAARAEATQAKLDARPNLKTVPSAYREQAETEAAARDEAEKKNAFKADTKESKDDDSVSTASATPEPNESHTLDPAQEHLNNKSVFNSEGVNTAIGAGATAGAAASKNSKNRNTYDGISPDLTVWDEEDNQYPGQVGGEATSPENASTTALKSPTSEYPGATVGPANDSHKARKTGVLAAAATATAKAAKKLSGSGSTKTPEIDQAYEQGITSASYDAGHEAGLSTGADRREVSSGAFVKHDSTSQSGYFGDSSKTLDPKKPELETDVVGDSQPGILGGAASAIGAVGTAAVGALGFKSNNPQDDTTINAAYEAGKNKATKEHFEQLGSVAGSDDKTRSTEETGSIGKPVSVTDSTSTDKSSSKSGLFAGVVGAAAGALGYKVADADDKPAQKDGDLTNKDAFSTNTGNSAIGSTNTTDVAAPTGNNVSSREPLGATVGGAAPSGLSGKPFNKDFDALDGDDLTIKQFYDSGYSRGIQDSNTKSSTVSGSTKVPSSLVVEVIGVDDKKVAAKLAKKASKELAAQGIDLSSGKLVVNADTKEVYKLDGDFSSQASTSPVEDKSYQDSHPAAASTVPRSAAVGGAGVAAGTAFAGLHGEDKAQNYDGAIQPPSSSLNPKEDADTKSYDGVVTPPKNYANVDELPVASEKSRAVSGIGSGSTSKEPKLEQSSPQDSDIVVTVQGCDDSVAGEVANRVVNALKGKPEVLARVKEIRIDALSGLVRDENGAVVLENFGESKPGKETAGVFGAGALGGGALGAAGSGPKSGALGGAALGAAGSGPKSGAKTGPSGAASGPSAATSTGSKGSAASANVTQPLDAEVSQPSPGVVKLPVTRETTRSAQPGPGGIRSTGTTTGAGAGTAGAAGTGSATAAIAAATAADKIGATGASTGTKTGNDIISTSAASSKPGISDPEEIAQIIGAAGAAGVVAGAASHESSGSKGSSGALGGGFLGGILGGSLFKSKEVPSSEKSVESGEVISTTNTKNSDLYNSNSSSTSVEDPSANYRYGKASGVTTGTDPRSINDIELEIVGASKDTESQLQKEKLAYLQQHIELIPVDTRKVIFDAKTGIAFDGAGNQISELSTQKSYSFDRKVNSKNQLNMPGSFFY
ncbi:hypothetical protein PSN45_003941 [Yamadazyma tenuis]|uniref:uncharacterized protein n=1 Tax=Candida tenuis TaxID=2315449 RepID=UPI0027A2D013|nr:hypothetical protein PSN45_003941 [Yamadazyma tenuis]